MKVFSFPMICMWVWLLLSFLCLFNNEKRMFLFAIGLSQAWLGIDVVIKAIRGGK